MFWWIRYTPNVEAATALTTLPDMVGRVERCFGPRLSASRIIAERITASRGSVP